MENPQTGIITNNEDEPLEEVEEVHLPIVVDPPVSKAAAKKRGRPKKEPLTEPSAKRPVGRPKALAQHSVPTPPPPPQTPMQIMADAIQHRQRQEREHTIAWYGKFHATS